jgi:hypothetical protein
MNLEEALESFCTFILRYKSTFHQLSNNTVGSFKGKQKEQYQIIKKALNNADISVSNLSASLHHLLIKVDQTKIKNKTFEMLSTLIDINPNFGERAGILGNVQLNKLKTIYESVKQQFNDSHTITSPFHLTQPQIQQQTHRNNAANEEIIKKASEKLKNLFKRINKKTMSIKIFNFHIENETAPKEISLNNFPVPFLAHDENFVKAYDSLIKKFQKEIMELCLNRVKEQKVILDERINTIKTSLEGKIEDVDSFVENLSKKSEDTWKPFIDASLEKASRIIIRSINVRKNINNETSIDEEWFHKDSHRNRFNSSRSSSRNGSVSRSRSRSGSRNISRNRENNYYKNRNNTKHTHRSSSRSNNNNNNRNRNISRSNRNRSRSNWNNNRSNWSDNRPNWNNNNNSNGNNNGHRYNHSTPNSFRSNRNQSRNHYRGNNSNGSPGNFRRSRNYNRRD